MDTLEGLAAECNFPWLLSNVVDMLHGLHNEGDGGEKKLLGNAKEYIIKEWQGFKVGQQQLSMLYGVHSLCRGIMNSLS